MEDSRLEEQRRGPWKHGPILSGVRLCPAQFSCAHRYAPSLLLLHTHFDISLCCDQSMVSVCSYVLVPLAASGCARSAPGDCVCVCALAPAQNRIREASGASLQWPPPDMIYCRRCRDAGKPERIWSTHHTQNCRVPSSDCSYCKERGYPPSKFATHSIENCREKPRTPPPRRSPPRRTPPRRSPDPHSGGGTRYVCGYFMNGGCPPTHPHHRTTLLLFCFLRPALFRSAACAGRCDGQALARQGLAIHGH